MPLKTENDFQWLGEDVVQSRMVLLTCYCKSLIIQTSRDWGNFSIIRKIELSDDPGKTCWELLVVNLFDERLGSGWLLLKREQRSNDYFFTFSMFNCVHTAGSIKPEQLQNSMGLPGIIHSTTRWAASLPPLISGTIACEAASLYSLYKRMAYDKHTDSTHWKIETMCMEAGCSLCRPGLCGPAQSLVKWNRN